MPSLDDLEVSYEINKRFPETKDFIINIVELYQLNKNEKLIAASIQEKYNRIKFIDFTRYFPKKEFYKYLALLFVPFLLSLLFYFINPNILKTGSENFLTLTKNPNVNQYQIEILNNNLEVPSGDDFELRFKVISPNYLPTSVKLNLNGTTIIPNYDKIHDYYFFNFKSVSKNVDFYIIVNNYKSSNYTLHVLQRPLLFSYSIKIKPPKYTKLKDYSLSSFKNIIVPQGTKIFISFKTLHVDSIFLSSKYKKFNIKKPFKIKLTINKSDIYRVVLINSNISDTITNFNIKCISDLYPTIKITVLNDSSIFSKYFFKGIISDDYGFSMLRFAYLKTGKKQHPNIRNFKYENIPFDKFSLEQSFFYSIDFSKLINSSDSIFYYFFSVRDNDILDGFKESRTQIFKYVPLDSKQIDSISTKLDSSIDSQNKSQLQLINQIQTDLENFQEKSINENISKWDQLNFLNNLINKNSSLKQMLDSVSRENKLKLNNLNLDSSQFKRQLELQKLLDSLLTKQIEDLLKALDSLKKNFDEKKFNELLNEYKKNIEQYNQNLKVTNEIYKRLKLEQDLFKNSEKLDLLSKQTEKFSNRIKKQSQLPENYVDSLANLKKDFDKINNSFDTLLSNNRNLKRPLNLDSLKTSFNKIDSNFNSLKNNPSQKTKNASEKLNKISKQLKTLSKKINNSLQQNASSQNSEDINYIKQLLTDLITLSFNQEKIYYSRLSNLSIFSNQYVQLQIEQNNLFSNYLVIKDSLIDLAQRNISVSKPILSTINNLDNDFNRLQSNNSRKHVLLIVRDIISNFNKLSLIMNESLNQMKNSSSNGSGSSNNSSKGQSPMPDLKQIQKSLEKQLESMLQKIKNGKQISPEELAKQLAKQEYFNKLIEQNLNNSSSLKQKQLLNEIKQLNEKNINDIINNNLSQDMLTRQRKIKTKLLESEKANMQQKTSNKRISNTSKNILHHVNKYDINTYKKNNYNTFMYFKSNKLSLTNFYKKYYDAYVIRSSRK